MLNMTKELVVSYYKENLSWLNKIKDYKITVYNKSDVEIPNTIKLDNVGREMHTYFHHIVTNYDNLSDWVFFTQAEPFDHVRNYDWLLDVFPNSLRYSRLSIDDCHFFSNGVFKEKLVSQSNGRPYNVEILNIDTLWSSLFTSPPIGEYSFVAGCLFCITKEQIRMRDISFYEKCKKITEERERSPWEFERMMFYVFNKNLI
jgi:hypothetical protein